MQLCPGTLPTRPCRREGELGGSLSPFFLSDAIFLLPKLLNRSRMCAPRRQ